MVSQVAPPPQEPNLTGQAASVLFYSDFPSFRYHNVEPMRKARAFALAGYDVVYVSCIGIHNPTRRLRISKAARLAWENIRSPIGSSARGDRRPRTATLAVIPPRQVDLIRRLNAVWIAHQLRSAIDDWSRTVAWVRWPTPEVVRALAPLQPAAVVYECVDAHWLAPAGPTGVWAEMYHQAEHDLVRLADVVVAPSQPIADRFRGWGAEVRLLPHGVDPFPWSERQAQRELITVGFVGTLDFRLDTNVLRHVAERHPDWRLRLIGPVQAGFDSSAFADLSNVGIEPPVPYERLPETLSGFTAGVLPYFDHPFYDHMCPVKNLELLAAGKPAVVRPSPALQPFAHLLYFARTPEEFVEAIERAIAEDTVERRRARRAVAEANSWDLRLGEAVSLLEDLLARRKRA